MSYTKKHFEELQEHEMLYIDDYDYQYTKWKETIMQKYDLYIFEQELEQNAAEEDFSHLPF